MTHFIRPAVLRCLRMCICVVTVCMGDMPNALSAKPNVLFIAVDDLRVELGCYGSRHVVSPNIDRLAEQGMLFGRAYCQQTVCNPSRASLLTGMRPDSLRVWDLPTHFRSHTPEAVTLPQWFKQHGYHTQCVGKIFHNWRQDAWKGDPVSWSVPSVMHYNSHSNDQPLSDGEVPPNLAKAGRGTECRDVPDQAYFDGRIAERAVEVLRTFATTEQPFFLAVGFWKPHTPFNAPKRYWDMYDRAKIPVPRNLIPPQGVPEIALTDARYDGRQNTEELRELHHGHLAAISYLDRQVGRVLDELDSLKMRDETIVLFWSDHGLHVGEHGLMNKTTLFELDAHVPLIIDAPEYENGQRSDALVELLDIYPTLVELCGLPQQGAVEGTSLVPLLSNPTAVWSKVALTQSPRPSYLKGGMPKSMGYSIRTDRFRYTEWRSFPDGEAVARELYDHWVDPLENRNVIGEIENAKAIDRLKTQLAEVVGKE